jgi:hypothetical protein
MESNDDPYLKAMLELTGARVILAAISCSVANRTSSPDNPCIVRLHPFKSPSPRVLINVLSPGGLILQGLQSDDDSEVLTALTQLNETITYSSDESLLLAGFNGTTFVPSLVRHLSSPDPTVLLLTTKILTQIFDQIPQVIIVAVQAGAPQVRSTPPLRAKIRSAGWDGTEGEAGPAP